MHLVQIKEKNESKRTLFRRGEKHIMIYIIIVIIIVIQRKIVYEIRNICHVRLTIECMHGRVLDVKPLPTTK